MFKLSQNYWYKSGLLTLLEGSISTFLGFAGVFLLLRSLSKDAYGTWVLFFTVSSFVEMARYGMVQNALVRFLAYTDKEQYPRIATTSFFINFGLTVFSVLLLLGLATPLSKLWNVPELPPMLHYYCITTIFLTPLTQFNFMQQANLDFKGIFFANISYRLIFFLYVLYRFVHDHQISLLSLAQVQTFAAMCAALLSYFLAKPYLRFSKQISLHWLYQLLHFGKYVFGTNLVSMLSRNLDRMMLGAMHTTTEVSLYDVAIKINNLLEVPSTAIASVVYPQNAIRSQAQGKEAVRYLYEKSVGAILAIVIPGILLFVIFAKPIVEIIAGSAYQEAAHILVITVLFTLYIPFARQFGTILDSSGKPRTNFLFVLTGFVLTFLCNYFFIQKYDTIGAAYGTLLAYTIMFIANQYYLYKTYNIRTFKTFSYTLLFYKNIFLYIKNKFFNPKA
ncbi:MAG: flippase [Chitinophagales bacterium]|nr:flippase [Chitinophagales bacterium]